jgi:hypothetical protein
MDFCWKLNVGVEERFGVGYVCCSWCSGRSVFCISGLAFCYNDIFKRIVSEKKGGLWVPSFLSPLRPSDFFVPQGVKSENSTSYIPLTARSCDGNGSQNKARSSSSGALTE